ncbi:MULTISPECIES: enoyl-[acyl-carrier-protein] reductase FabK [Cloacibacillus]|uniref:enoyl-[acyl-carrier-protein] reductase FabK n=1 Tax=Cloacibacillus TaxID=508459 RepID=UPI0023577378|nr:MULTISPECIES: enoyl-[acyl-carrier-protein] reductase FabK [Cloacibacillus]MCD7877327.1 enoyl-[acyl-carrier-protein] reductase FabK [Cloacibacillus porcorum]MCI5866463.1 enoyl-[acyl-carrier-protein] reductase FabK [Cloacibacillus porcorum]MDD7650189.1 enoyl-[acyl-carrier-protein] reductase FabK [Cloacibacillus porcorum]MDY4092710.1 enoyl-[acyl-carrier-protein] reductase FabK [Cloacibacillus porcorum]
MFEQNPVTNLLKIKYPIIQGGMAWVADADLAAAVSNGGGLGIIAAANMPADLLEQQLIKIRTLTDKPFGLNIMLLSPTADDALELAAKHGVPVVTTGAGMPGKVLDKLKPLGTTVIPVVASVSHAERIAKQGADAVIAEGMEAGGHIGEITTMNLVPQIADAVNLPVIAAGGIADGRGAAAAFVLGATGVQMGTRFVCAEECNVHINYKQKIVKANDRATAVTGRSLGHPVRAIKNKFIKQYEELEKRGASAEELEALGAGKLRLAVVEGDTEMGSLMAGQSAGLVHAIEPAAVIIESVISQMNNILSEMARYNR